MDEHAILPFKQRWIVSFFIPFVLFLVIIIFFYPTYHSADDNYLLYEMSGAFGNGATNLLHYNYTWHPYLTYPLKKLFELFPGENWYSISLYSLHFLSWLCLTNIIFRRISFLSASFLVLILFAVFGSQFLLRITYSNTSILLTIAALMYLGDKVFSRRNLTVVNYVITVVLLAVAGMLRFHVLIPFMVLFLTLLSFRSRKNISEIVLVYFISFSLLFILNKAHKNYYERHISDWSKKEAYRQAVLSYDNHSKQIDTAKMSAKMNLQNSWLKNGIILDTNFLNSTDIRNIVQRKKSARNFKDLRGELYWLLTNNRLYMITTAGMLFFCLTMVNVPNRKKVIIILPGLALLSMCAYLLLFMKLPHYFLSVTLFFYSCCCILFFISNAPGRFHSLQKYGLIVFWMGCITWGAVRLYKLNKENIEGQKMFFDAWNELSPNKDKLYIAPYFSIPFDDLGVFISPLKYPLPNVVFKNSLMNNAQEQAYKRFGIRSSNDLFLNEHIRFIGTSAPLVQEYYERSHGVKLEVVQTPEKYNHLMVTLFQIKSVDQKK